jgi:hypothetical protein
LKGIVMFRLGRFRLKYCAFYSLFGILGLLTISGCSKNSGNPADDSGDDSGVTVIESKTGTVGSGGGSVTLTDGSAVVFPAGALATSSKVTVKSVSPASYFDGTDVSRAVISLEGISDTLSIPAELRVPLPAGFTEADSASVFGGLLDGVTGAVEAEPVKIRTIGGDPYAVIEATHFSSRVIEWIFGEEPPATYGPLDIPYYGQGSSNYCWATSLNMVTQAAKYNEAREIYEIIGRVGVDEGGVTDWAFRFNSNISDIVVSRTGVRPTRYQWDYINADQALNYIKKEIGLCHHPVAIYVGTWEHAVVIVGYNGSTLQIHNPNNTVLGAIGYTARPWTDFTANMGVRDKIVTITVPKDLDASRPSTTVNITTGAFEFTKPRTDQTDQSKIYRFAWDYREQDGFSFRETTADTGTDVLPGTVATLKQGGDIEVVNASRTTPKTVTVWLDIFGKGPDTTHYSANKQVTVGANTSGRVKFDDIPVDEFRDNDSKAVEYRMQTSVFENGSMVDSADITFTIDTVTPEIASLTPNKTGVGSVVTIAGKRLGTVRGQSVVTLNGVAFAGTDYVSWNDTEIKVKVPAGTKTGPVVVKRGTVSSNAQTLTIVEQTVYNGTWNYDQFLVSAVATWTVTGNVTMEDVSPEQTYYPYYKVNLNTPFELTINIALSLKNDSVRIDRPDGGYTIIVYKTPVRVEDESSLFIKGEFSYSHTYTNTTFTATGSFNAKNQFLGPRVTYYIPYDRFMYDKDGGLISEERNLYDSYNNAEVISVVVTSGY